MKTSRWLSLAGIALIFCARLATADAPGSLAAYFEGDKLREALIKLTPKSEPSVRRLDQTLTATSRFVRAEVIALRENGAIVSLKSYSSVELHKDSPTPLEQPFFIYGVPEDLAGGSIWEGRVYPAGRFQYTANDKSEQVVNALAVSKEWAVRAMENASAKK